MEVRSRVNHSRPDLKYWCPYREPESIDPTGTCWPDATNGFLQPNKALCTEVGTLGLPAYTALRGLSFRNTQMDQTIWKFTTIATR
jgi:hypothetical protein